MLVKMMDEFKEGTRKGREGRQDLRKISWKHPGKKWWERQEEKCSF